MSAHFTTQLAYRRRPSRQVAVGNVGVGGDAPIRIQSMLTSNTWDVEAVIAEMRGLVEAGCEIVRLTVPTQKDLDALPAIRTRMEAEGLRVPLVADIHFNPRLALGCVPHVEKVRINPGNYVDQKKFQVREYSDAQYAQELDRIEQTLLPLIGELKTHGRALRVGVNHGSLSDRIMNRYGDNPQGMVESAMEFLRILARHGYHDTILSMKSSNPLVVIRAYRLLVLAMEREGMDYPLHLGVTEAGDGADGRVKSAVGIGALLCDGLGDTIRVSLTEPSANEIPAAKELLAALEALRSDSPAWPEAAYSAPIDFARRETQPLRVAGVAIGGGAGGGDTGSGDTGGGEIGGGDTGSGDTGRSTAPVAFLAINARDPGNGGGFTPPPAEFLHSQGRPQPGGADFDGEIGASTMLIPGDQPMVRIPADQVDGPRVAQLLELAGEIPKGVLLVVEGAHPLHPLRRLAGLLDAQGLRWPLAVMIPQIEKGQMPLSVAAEIGSLAADGLVDAVICPDADSQGAAAEFCRTLLQAARLRTYKTEYISCPSCGRTLFDLQETTERIKARTVHLTGLKIGIMGCIVNGPGEMADADFGYVGGAPGKVNLYKGQQCLERGVPTGEAVERLVELIKEHGRWVEPPGGEA